MKIFHFAILAAMLPWGVVAQTSRITGTVTDFDGQALIGANILLKGTLLGGASDKAGAFTIRSVPAGQYTVRVSMIGYETHEERITVGAGAAVTLPVRLKESPLKTEEIVVTAGKRRQSMEDVPVSMAVFDAEDIQARTIIRLDDALRYIPGVNITESQINIRGSSGYSRALGSRVLLLVDGMPMLTADAGEAKFDIVPMYAIDRIEVVKGAGSALYGSSALGGVVNIITAEPEKSFLNVRMYSGFYDDPEYEQWKWWGESPRFFNGVDVVQGDAFTKVKYLVSAGVRNNQQYRLNDDYLRYNFGGKVSYHFDPRQKLSLSANYVSDIHGNWVYWDDIQNALVPPANADLSETVTSDKMQVAMEYQKTVNARLAYSVKSVVFRTAFDVESDTSDFSMRPDDRVQSDAQSYFLEAQGSYAISPKDILTVGVSGSYNNVDALAYGNHYSSNGAVYAQNDLEPLAGLQISAGVRFDYSQIDSDASDSQVNPKVGVSYAMKTGTVLRASAGTGFRAPSIAERYTSAASGPVKTKPNPDLESERSSSYEVGVKQPLPGPVLLDAAAFYSDYSNLVEPEYDPVDGRIVFNNITKARIYGFEISALAAPVPDVLTLSAGYTFMEPRDITDGKDDILKYRPKHLLYCSGTFTWMGFTLGADFRFVSKIRNIDAALAFLIQDADKRVPTKVTDVRVSYNFRRIGYPVEATVSVRNLFQYNYSEIVGNIAPIRNYMLTLDMRI